MLCVAGERTSVLMSPSDASQVFKDERSFAFDSFIDLVYRSVGNVSDEANRFLGRTPVSHRFIQIRTGKSSSILGTPFCTNSS